MVRTLVCCVALLSLSAVGVTRAPAQQKVDHPHLRAALQELREARTELKAAKDNWPPGYRDRALASIDSAINSVKGILEVKDVDSFRGYDRQPDYYKAYSDHPRLRSALVDLREARDELRAAKANYGNLKEQALENIDVAIGDIITLMRYNKR